jgi:hypothetical protein
MATENGNIVEYMLQTLDKLKAGQEEISARLNASQRVRVVPVNIITSAGDQHRRFGNEIHGTMPELKNRMEADESQQWCGYVERTLIENPSQNMRLNTAESPVKPHITQHSSETPCKMCEPPVVREKPRYPPADFVSFPARPAMDVRSPRSLAPGMIDEHRGYDSCSKGGSQNPTTVCGRGARRYMRPNLSAEDIFWRERQAVTCQKRDIPELLERNENGRREEELKGEQSHKGPAQARIQRDAPKVEIESPLAVEALSDNCSCGNGYLLKIVGSNQAERTEPSVPADNIGTEECNACPTAQVECTPQKKTKSRELRGGVLYSKNPRTKANGLNAPAIKA